ncbi:MAG: hypothetical protein H0U18_09960 [Pyrinomonadaceae bacterium]|nr:hypothetical protein [Pyrinomonadaceae bacterium]
MEVIKKGSIEPLLVVLRDRLENVATLASVTTLQFDTKKKSDNSPIQSNVPVILDTDFPMTASCSINTTLAGYVSGEEYKLYIKYTSGGESPVLGPQFFRVEDD